MEIRDPVLGPISLDEKERAVIDSPAFQRLRRIKQLGFTELTFPGATHTRYLHSLGAMHLASRALRSVADEARFPGREALPRLTRMVRLAALLHDVGHPPLSHATETSLPHLADLRLDGFLDVVEDRRATHEDYTLKLILDSALTTTLEATFADEDITPRDVAGIISLDVAVPRERYEVGGVSTRPLLHQLISSELDVDRMDYLLRDSYFTGASYGAFDLDWLIRCLTWREVEGELTLALDSRGLFTFNDFLLSRYHMFILVYFHYKSVIYEKMLELFLTNVRDTFSITADPDAYVALDDVAMTTIIKSSSDVWARRIMARSPYRKVAELNDDTDAELISRLKAAVDEGTDDALWLESRGILSKYYWPGRSSAMPPISVRRNDDPFTRGTYAPLEECTDLFDKYARPVRICRLYLPEGADYRRLAPLFGAS